MLDQIEAIIGLDSGLSKVYITTRTVTIRNSNFTFNIVNKSVDFKKEEPLKK